jgi:hypothetical protein
MTCGTHSHSGRLIRSREGCSRASDKDVQSLKRLASCAGVTRVVTDARMKHFFHISVTFANETSSALRVNRTWLRDNIDVRSDKSRTAKAKPELRTAKIQTPS